MSVRVCFYNHQQRHYFFQLTLQKTHKPPQNLNFPHWTPPPTIPTLYGLPKKHKSNTPPGPIIFCIGSATHKIVCAIAKIFDLLFSTNSPSHSINYGELLNKIKDINIQNKTMNSLDITSFYTKLPIKKCVNFLATHLIKIKFNSSLLINT